MELATPPSWRQFLHLQAKVPNSEGESNNSVVNTTRKYSAVLKPIILQDGAIF